jgi:hypothetical protein
MKDQTKYKTYMKLKYEWDIEDPWNPVGSEMPRGDMGDGVYDWNQLNEHWKLDLYNQKDILS